MNRVLTLVTVAARFRVGELANSSGDIGAEKLLWLNRLSRSGSADIALLPMRESQSCRLHGCYRRQSLKSGSACEVEPIYSRLVSVDEV